MTITTTQFKTEIENRIAAATGSTTLKDLTLIKANADLWLSNNVGGTITGYAALETLIQAKQDTLSGASSLTDLSFVGVSAFPPKSNGSSNGTILTQVVELIDGADTITLDSGEVFLKEGKYVTVGYDVSIGAQNKVPVLPELSSLPVFTGRQGRMIRLANNDLMYIINPLAQYVSAGGTGPWVLRTATSFPNVSNYSVEEAVCYFAFVTANGTIIAQYSSGTLIKSSDGGLIWTSLTMSNLGMVYSAVNTDAGTTIVSGTLNTGYGLIGVINNAVTTLSEVTWAGTGGDQGSAQPGSVYDLIKLADNTILAGLISSSGGAIFKSTNNGVAWTTDTNINNIQSLSTDGVNVLCTTNTTTIHKRNSSGVWSSSAPATYGLSTTRIFYINNSWVARKTTTSYLKSTDTGVTWSEVTLPTSVTQYGFFNFNHALGTLLICFSFKYPLMTSDLLAFTEINTSSGRVINNQNLICIGKKEILLFNLLGNMTNNLLVSRDAGVTWELKSTGFAATQVYYLGGSSFVACNVSSLNMYVTHDGGNTWSSAIYLGFSLSNYNSASANLPLIASNGDTFIFYRGSNANVVQSNHANRTTFASYTVAAEVINNIGIVFFKPIGLYIVACDVSSGTNRLYSSNTGASWKSLTSTTASILENPNTQVLAINVSDTHLVVVQNGELSVFDGYFKKVGGMALPNRQYSTTVQVKHINQDAWILFYDRVVYLTLDGFITVFKVITLADNNYFIGGHLDKFIISGIMNKISAVGIAESSNTSNTSVKKYVRIK